MATRRCLICGYFVNKKYNGERLFADWLGNVLTSYLIDTDRRIFVYTDNRELIKYGGRLVKISYLESDFSDIGENRLKKIMYLDELCRSEEADKADCVAFFQSNLRIKVPVIVEEVLPDGYDIAAPLLPEFEKTGDFKKYYWNNLVIPQGKSVTDISKIDCTGFKYMQDGHMVGVTARFSELIAILKRLILEDKQRGCRITGQPFDERYFNYYLNAVNGGRFKVRTLETKRYNNRNRDDPSCKIYQIDKEKSCLFTR